MGGWVDSFLTYILTYIGEIRDILFVIFQKSSIQEVEEKLLLIWSYLDSL